jgi:glyceraldehyde-3-phosphate dehydrogenase (NAD(P))
VSCNTTSIVRVLGALENAGLLLRARGVTGRAECRRVHYSSWD